VSKQRSRFGRRPRLEPPMGRLYPRPRTTRSAGRKDEPRPRAQRPGPGPRHTSRQEACCLPRRVGQQTRNREGRGRRARRWVVGWAPCRRRQGMCVGSASAGATARKSLVSCGPSKNVTAPRQQVPPASKIRLFRGGGGAVLSAALTGLKSPHGAV